jgi:hypothetical protein
MAQAARRQPITTEAQVRSHSSPCGICGGQSDTRTGSPPPPPSTSVFSCYFHSTGAPVHGKTNEKELITFSTGSHKKPEGWGASVASAAAPVSKKMHYSHLQHCYSTNESYSDARVIKFRVTKLYGVAHYTGCGSRIGQFSGRWFD